LGKDANFHCRIVGTAPTIPAGSPRNVIRNRRNTLIEVEGAAHDDGLSFADCSRTKSVIACGVTFLMSNVVVLNTDFRNNVA